MSLWFKPTTLKDVHKRYEGVTTINKALGIKLTEIGDDFVRGTMPVDERTIQPAGVLHGGASCVLAETVGSVASHLCINPETHYSVGLDIHTSHIRSAKNGYVTATAKPIHIGRSTHIWEISIVNEEDKMVSLTRLTTFVKEK